MSKMNSMIIGFAILGLAGFVLLVAGDCVREGKTLTGQTQLAMARLATGKLALSNAHSLKARLTGRMLDISFQPDEYSV